MDPFPNTCEGHSREVLRLRMTLLRGRLGRHVPDDRVGDGGRHHRVAVAVLVLLRLRERVPLRRVARALRELGDLRDDLRERGVLREGAALLGPALALHLRLRRLGLALLALLGGLLVLGVGRADGHGVPFV
jgi:hypothetical protein